jgi:hypothetical protein
MLYGISVRILVRRQNKSQAKCFSAMATPGHPDHLPAMRA